MYKLSKYPKIELTYIFMTYKTVQKVTKKKTYNKAQQKLHLLYLEFCIN